MDPSTPTRPARRRRRRRLRRRRRRRARLHAPRGTARPRIERSRRVARRAPAVLWLLWFPDARSPARFRPDLLRRRAEKGREEGRTPDGRKEAGGTL